MVLFGPFLGRSVVVIPGGIWIFGVLSDRLVASNVLFAFDRDPHIDKKAPLKDTGSHADIPGWGSSVTSVYAEYWACIGFDLV